MSSTFHELPISLQLVKYSATHWMQVVGIRDLEKIMQDRFIFHLATPCLCFFLIVESFILANLFLGELKCYYSLKT